VTLFEGIKKDLIKYIKEYRIWLLFRKKRRGKAFSGTTNKNSCFSRRI
jgi:hypothetical protein